MNSLEPPHSFLAARELLNDLRAVPELAPYVLPELWQSGDQHSAITALSQSMGACVAVGVAETTLPAAGQAQQGGMVRVGVAVYVFQPAEGTLVVGGQEELRQQVLLTVIRTVNRWFYTTPGGLKIKGILTSLGEVDLSTINKDFAKALNADALAVEIPLMLTRPRPEEGEN